MPAEAVTTQLDTVLTAEVGNLIGLLEVPYTLFRMQLTGLHIVLGSDTAKLTFYQSNLAVIANVALVEGNANQEIILVGILQFYRRIGIGGRAPLCPRTQTVHGQHDGQNGLKSLFHLCDVFV